METRKLFLAIPIPTALKKKLQHIVFQNKKIEQAKWAPKESYHITVQYYGEQNDAQISDLITQLEEQLSGIKVFMLRYERAILYPTKEPRMIWARFGYSSKFEDIVTNTNVLKQKEKTSPKPHITIAKLKPEFAPLTIEQDNTALTFGIDKINLYASRLVQNKRRHEVLKTFELSEF